MDKLLKNISNDFRLKGCFTFLDTSNKRKKLQNRSSRSGNDDDSNTSEGDNDDDDADVDVHAEEVDVVERYIQITPHVLQTISKDFGNNAEYYFDTSPGSSITVCETTTKTIKTNKNEKSTTASVGNDNTDVVEVESFTCPVCFDDDIPTHHRFEFWCINKQHKLCYECAIGHVMSYVNDGRPEKIKCYDSKCDHLLCDEEIAIIFGYGDPVLGMFDQRYISLDILKRDHAISKDPFEYTTCPQPDCNFTVARSSRGASDHVICGQCNHTFCGNCLDSYHYRSTCIEKQQTINDWRHWILTGRDKYWQQHKAIQKRESIKIRKAEQQRIKDVIKTEIADEKWKTQNCRHCPNCDRLVNRIEGCDLMYCGADYHSRPVVADAAAHRRPVGCHRQFNWKDTRPYKSVKTGTKVKIDESWIAGAAGSANKPVHQYISCDSCNKTDIVGLRFECINCPSYNICEECEASSSSNNKNRRHGDGNHIFRIIQYPPPPAVIMDAP